jgi:hypothetical protein
MDCVLLIVFSGMFAPVRLDYSTPGGTWQEQQGEFLKNIYRRNKPAQKSKTPANRS